MNFKKSSFSRIKDPVSRLEKNNELGQVKLNVEGCFEHSGNEVVV